MSARKAAPATSASSATSARARKSKKKLRLGFIGVGNRGGQLLDAFLQHDDAEVAAICDVYKPYLEEARQKIGKPVKSYADFRDLIDDDELDAVVIATPDHWHAIQCVNACDAGKDVYLVEREPSIGGHMAELDKTFPTLDCST